MFIGRDEELARLKRCAELAASGTGQVILLIGEAGIGKSRLAGQLLTWCASRGFGTFAGAADEVDQRRPFWVVSEALRVRDGGDRTRQRVLRLLDDDDRPQDEAASETKIAELLVDCVMRDCEARPVAVLLDDLQWADESSLVVAHRLAAVAGAQPLLLICALRRYPAGATLRSLLAALDYRGALRVELRGLDPDAVAALAAELAGAALGESLRRLLQQTAGNPFYVTEVVSCLAREGRIEISAQGTAEVGQAWLPRSLHLTLLKELRFLPDATLDALRAAAVVGGSFSVAEVAMLVPSPVGDVVAALRPALRAGILIEDRDRLAFRHDLIREAVYADMTTTARNALHRELAARLAASGAPVSRVAGQLVLGASPGDREAVCWLRHAAEQAMPASPAIASDLFTHALQLAGAELYQRLLPGLVRPLLWTGQAARAEQLCAEGLTTHPRGEDEALFRLGLADARLLQGRFTDARAACREALKHDACLDAADRLHLRTVQALAGVYLGEPAALAEAKDIVTRAPTSISRATAQETVAQWELFTGRADRAVAAFEQVEGLRAPAVLRNRLWQDAGIRVRMWHALALVDIDRLDEAAGLLELDIAAKLTVPALPHAFLAVCRYHAGRFTEAAAECAAAHAGAQAAGSLLPASAPALAAVVALRRGDLTKAERLTARAEQVRTAAEAAGDTLARWARMLLLEASGHAEQAAEAAAAAAESYWRAGFASYRAWHGPDLVRVALAAGRRQQAERAVAGAEQAAEQLPVASRRAGALRARGLYDADADTLLDAVAACREVPRPVDLAHALLDAAVASARTGQQDRAKSMATEGLALLAGLEAAGDEQRAKAALRAAGLRLGARRGHTRAATGWQALTEAEVKVIDLVAEGRSNPEIARALYVSPRTVGWHVSNALRKLGLGSRVELAAEVLRHRSGR